MRFNLLVLDSKTGLFPDFACLSIYTFDTSPEYENAETYPLSKQTDHQITPAASAVYSIASRHAHESSGYHTPADAPLARTLRWRGRSVGADAPSTQTLITKLTASAPTERPRQQIIRSNAAQGVENSELSYVPARQTTLFHHSARKADGGSENPQLMDKAKSE